MKQIPSITHNNKCVISLQYLKKKESHEVDFLHVEKQTFQQVDAVNIGEYGQPRPKYSK